MRTIRRESTRRGVSTSGQYRRRSGRPAGSLIVIA
jgi:hypothetical protein